MFVGARFKGVLRISWPGRNPSASSSRSSGWRPRSPCTSRCATGRWPRRRNPCHAPIRRRTSRSADRCSRTSSAPSTTSKSNPIIGATTLMAPRRRLATLESRGFLSGEGRPASFALPPARQRSVRTRTFSSSSARSVSRTTTASGCRPRRPRSTSSTPSPIFQARPLSVRVA